MKKYIYSMLYVGTLVKTKLKIDFQFDLITKFLPSNYIYDNIT